MTQPLPPDHREWSHSSINRDGSDFTILKIFDDLTGRMTIDELVEIPFISLPVKLNYFTARETGEKVELTWSTSEEENSDRYIVERSTDGTSYTAVAIVQASGHTSSLMSYSTVDLHPFEGKSYYRLQMCDKDGSFNYSAVQVVDLTKKINGFRTYSNPPHGSLTIEGKFAGTSLSISVIDLSGKIIRKITFANSTVMTLDVSDDIAEGVYTLSIEDGATIKSSLFMKTR